MSMLGASSSRGDEPDGQSDGNPLGKQDNGRMTASSFACDAPGITARPPPQPFLMGPRPLSMFRSLFRVFQQPASVPTPKFVALLGRRFSNFGFKWTLDNLLILVWLTDRKFVPVSAIQIVRTSDPPH